MLTSENTSETIHQGPTDSNDCVGHTIPVPGIRFVDNVFLLQPLRSYYGFKSA